ncbi:uncharacterized protein LOC120149046 [Hibiscus syriacus]|uniref:uncharacterized protein LOC120149046 n=1 Tax=Hibiscus syriacus TaxID=106335 RepID=UPI001924529A|nr:uncharacterized protein LOC120149046 [Hibiscus syriacus]
MSHLLNVVACNGLIRFHPKCKRVSLTHLSFADELLIFCYGDESSILGVVEVLEIFYDLSGLQLNTGKYELFACGVQNDILSRMLAVTGFKLGRLPVRYLGVPLVTRKLAVKDCIPLIDNIRSKLNIWQLVLPNEVIRQVEQFCMRFFWKGGDIPTRGNILANAWSLWVVWIKEYAMKETAYWEVSPKPQFNWILRKLLKLRNKAVVLFGSIVDWNMVKSKWVWES